MSAPAPHRIAARVEDEYGELVRVVCACGRNFAEDEDEQVTAEHAHWEHVRAMSLAGRAKDIQDRIGWCDYTDAGEMASAVTELARMVVEIAGIVERLRDATPEP